MKSTVPKKMETGTHNSKRTKTLKALNVQKCSKNYTMFLAEGRISQKIRLSMYILTVLGSRGTVVKCTAVRWIRSCLYEKALSAKAHV